MTEAEVLDALRRKGFHGTVDRFERGAIDLEQARGELAGIVKPTVAEPTRISPADFAAELKAQGVGRQESWSRWVQRTSLRPGMDAKDWYAIYDSVTPAVLPTPKPTAPAEGASDAAPAVEVAPPAAKPALKPTPGRGEPLKVGQRVMVTKDGKETMGTIQSLAFNMFFRKTEPEILLDDGTIAKSPYRFDVVEDQTPASKSIAPPAPLPTEPVTEPAKLAVESAPTTVEAFDAQQRAEIARLQAKQFKSNPDEARIERLTKLLAIDPAKWQVGQGVGYRVNSGGRQSQINRGFRIVEVYPDNKAVLVRSVADTGLTTSGGDNDVISDEWISMVDLLRDKKYDAAKAAPPADVPAVPARAEPSPESGLAKPDWREQVGTWQPEPFQYGSTVSKEPQWMVRHSGTFTTYPRSPESPSKPLVFGSSEDATAFADNLNRKEPAPGNQKRTLAQRVVAKGRPEAVALLEPAPKQEVPPAPPPVPPLAEGKTTTVKTSRGTPVVVRYALVEATGPITSHTESLARNPYFPAELQPRERDRVASREQIQNIARSLEPEWLGASPMAATGAPIVGQDMLVESGNGRILALRRAYADHPDMAAKYKAWLVASAEEFGLPPDAIAGAKQPVLVRIRETDVDRAQFVDEANVSVVAGKSAAEQAMVDAAKMGPELMERFRPDEAGDLMVASNADFRAWFASEVVPSEERNAFQTQEGTVSLAGLNRMRNAVFARAYGSASIVERMAESLDNNIKRITGGMLRAAPMHAKVRYLAEKGALHPLDLGSEIVAAAGKFAELRSAKVPVESYLQQTSLFGEEMSPEAKAILEAMDKFSGSEYRVGDFLAATAIAVEELGPPGQQSMFGSGDPPTKAEVIAGAVKAVGVKYGKKESQVPLFTGAALGSGSFGSASSREMARTRGSLGGGKPSPQDYPLGRASEVAEQTASSRSSLSDIEAEMKARVAASVAADERAGERGAARLPGRPPKGPTAEGEFEFTVDPKVEAHYQADYGVPKPSVGERLKAFGTSLINKTTREFEHLPPTGRFALFRYKLLEHMKQPGVVGHRVVTMQRGLLDKLMHDPKRERMFERRVLVNDVMEDVSRGIEELPLGFTPDTAKKESARLDRATAPYPEIEEAIADRRRTNAGINADYGKAMKDVGMDVEGRFTREDYMHHQVLAYAQLDAGTGFGQRVKTPRNRGFLKARQGSVKEIMPKLKITADQFEALRIGPPDGRAVTTINAAILERFELDPTEPPGRQLLDKGVLDMREARWLDQAGGHDISGYPEPEPAEREVKHINTNYLQVEYKVRAQMLLDIETARFLRFVNDQYGLLPALERQAKEQNMAAMRRHVAPQVAAANAGKNPATDKTYTADDILRGILNTKMAIGFTKIGKLAVDGELPDAEDGRWSRLITELGEVHEHNALARKEAKQKGRDEPPDLISLSDASHDQLFEYAAWLLKEHYGTEAAGAAATIFKGIHEKDKYIRETLGDKFVTWDKLVPADHVAWQPDPGHHFYMAHTIPEQLALRLQEAALLQGINLRPEDITGVRQQMVVGGLRQQYVLPKEIAATLDNMRKAPELDPVSKAYLGGVRAAKEGALSGPKGIFKYNARNLSGDAEGVAISNPASFRRVPKALSELYPVMVRHAPITGELYEWFKRGGTVSTFQIGELGDVNELPVFERLRKKHGSWTAIPAQLWTRYWNSARVANNLREATLRYADYLETLDYILKHGKPKNYGASRKVEIDALTDPRDKAFVLSNQRVGAYDQLSVVGNWLKKYTNWFWSWPEVNFRRTVGLIANAARDDKGSEKIGRAVMATLTIAGRRLPYALIRTPFMVMRLGRLALSMSAGWAMCEAYNQLRFPELVSQVPENVRNRPYIILGKDARGEVLYFDRLGMVGDFMSWFSMDAPHHLVRDWLNGKKTTREVFTDVVRAPVNNFWQGISPWWKQIIELPTGMKTYPNVFERGTIRDKMLYLFQAFKLGEEYKVLAGLPHRPYSESFQDLLVYSVDPGQAAYGDILDEKRRFMQRVGKYSSFAGAPSPRSNALYNLKLAIRYKDLRAAEKYIAEYVRFGGTAQGFETSLRNMRPLFGLNDAEERVFVTTWLDDEGRKKLLRAALFYDEVLVGRKKEGE
jgi:hypothetical protein